MSEQKELQFRVVCMDCTAIIRPGDPDALTSHGLCDTCLKTRMDELKRLGYIVDVPKEGAA